MSGNIFGESFKITTFGESHGSAIGVVIDGVKSGLKISEKDIQKELDKRKPGQSNISTSRKEGDVAEILSGVFEGKTTGTPICVLIRNTSAHPSDYEKIKNLFRPGHADFTYWKKFGLRDYRGGGRSSGRETIGRVAAGAVAKKILKKEKIKITAYVKSVAGTECTKIDFSEIEKNPVRCPDSSIAKKIEKAILKAKSEGNSLGGIVEIVVSGTPPGLGEPVFGKLDAELAKALMGIGAVKGVEIGSGFSSAKLNGKQMDDEIISMKSGKAKFASNNSGGVLGGISTGQDIVLRIAVKPTASISIEQKTVDESGRPSKIKTEGRHDPCICPRIVPVAESMVALVLADALQAQSVRKENME